MPVKTNCQKCKTCTQSRPDDICKHPDNRTGKQCNCRGDKYEERNCLNCGYCWPFGKKDICGVWRGGRNLPPKKDQKNCKDWTEQTGERLPWKYQDESIEWHSKEANIL